MHIYSVFGGRLASEVVFDGLRQASSGPPTWRFHVGCRSSLPSPGEVISVDRVSPELSITLHREAGGGIRISYDAYGFGDFQVSGDGSTIRWFPGESPAIDQIRWILLGRVLAMAMYLSGTLCLHGSGVALEGGGICFLAPKFHGKSTLASALVASGARLITDDVLPVEPGPPVRVRPGVHSLRLWDGHGAEPNLPGSRRTVEVSGKVRIDDLPRQSLMLDAGPLNAIYVLAPVVDVSEHDPVVVRTRLMGMAAFETLVRHVTVAPNLPSREGRLLVEHTAAILRSVPVYQLRYVRDLSLLPEVVEQLLRWHAKVRG